jgi:hypothetical protein
MLRWVIWLTWSLGKHSNTSDTGKCFCSFVCCVLFERGVIFLVIRVFFVLCFVWAWSDTCIFVCCVLFERGVVFLVIRVFLCVVFCLSVVWYFKWYVYFLCCVLFECGVIFQVIRVFFVLCFVWVWSDISSDTCIFCVVFCLSVEWYF